MNKCEIKQLFNYCSGEEVLVFRTSNKFESILRELFIFQKINNCTFKLRYWRFNTNYVNEHVIPPTCMVFVIDSNFFSKYLWKLFLNFNVDVFMLPQSSTVIQAVHDIFLFILRIFEDSFMRLLRFLLFSYCLILLQTTK